MLLLLAAACAPAPDSGLPVVSDPVAAGPRWRVDDEGLFVDDRLRLRFAAWGRDAPTELGRVDPVEVGGRVERAHPGVTEWFRARPDGVEFGWDVATAPDGDGPLVLDMTVDGAGARPDGRGGLTLQADDGSRWDVRGLLVADADGAILPASLGATAGGLRVTVDDTDAAWPLTIDPLLTTATWSAEGGAASSGFGAAVAGVGDIDGDGFDDVLVGAPRASSGQGRVELHLGSAAGPATAAAWSSSGLPSANAAYGTAVASACDVNGDGLADLVIGSPGYSNGQAGEGRAWMYPGSPAGPPPGAAWTAEPNRAGVGFGKALACLGDVDGDGYDDVLVGGPTYTNGQTNEGRAWLYRGSATGLATTEAWTVESNTANAQYGTAVAGVGDLDGDGFPDFAVGAPGLGTGGRVFVYRGGHTLSTTAAWTLSGVAPSAQFGKAVAGAGDVDGNGYADLLVGAPAYSNGQSGEGAIFLFVGSSAGLPSAPAWSVESNQAGAQLGAAVAGGGDVDGDGFDDLAAGAPAYDDGQTDEGLAELFVGGASLPSTTAAWSTEGNQAGATYGQALAFAGDPDGDGYADLLVGAPTFDDPEVDEGGAWLWRGVRDADGDGVAYGTDCDDADAHVGAASVYAYADSDLDGYGAGSGSFVCALPVGSATVDGDCDDTAAAVHPGASETCDGVDDDCDGLVDDADPGRVGGATTYADLDGDGFGAGAGSVVCVAPAGSVADSTDCDDTDAGTNPAATESCDGHDDDCDGLVDTADPGIVGTTFVYADADGDGFGAGPGSSACGIPAGTTPDATDCDDADAGTNPAATETCDGHDDDCDGLSDEGWPDADGDGTGDDCDPDVDGDGVANADDRCAGADDTADRDGDGVPDACDACPDDYTNDSDGDGVCDGVDPCPLDDPDDADGDGACASADPCPLDPDDDADGDGRCADVDPCPADPLDDLDGDGVCGDLDTCPAGDDATDTDADGVPDACDACPLDALGDRDGDGACDTDDPCPLDPGDDADGDGVCGDVDPCPLDPDDDLDGDGVCADADPCPLDPENDADADGACESVDVCVTLYDPDQADADGDGVGDACEADTDGDGRIDDVDTCPGADDTLDTDGDGSPDGCDACPLDPLGDTDGDGACDHDDPCPLDPADDADADGRCADADPCPADPENDVDGDGVCGDVDACPLDPANDADGDGLCADADTCPAGDDAADADEDGTPDACDLCPDDPTNDGDADGECGDVDPCPADPDDDADADGACADVDPCPFDPADDADADGRCADVDVCPLDPADDADADGVCGDVDDCPTTADPTQADRDGDGQGDACEPDVDGDGSPEDLDCDDGDASVHPGATEVCGDGRDQDCDGADTACVTDLVTLPPGFSVRNVRFQDQATRAGMQVHVSVTPLTRCHEDEGFVFGTTDAVRGGRPVSLPVVIGDATELAEHETLLGGFVGCDRPFARTRDHHGRLWVYTPRFNAGDHKAVTRWRVGQDSDHDGVSDVDELSVACTDPLDRRSH